MRLRRCLGALLVLGLGACDGPTIDADAGPLVVPPGYDAGASPTPYSPDAGDTLASGSTPSGEPVPACAIDLTPELDRLGVPGLSAALIADGALHCTAVAGYASVADERPVTPDVPFLWASVSKTVTATAAMSLYDQGRFGLDDDVNDYLPFEVRNPNCADEPITFRHLLTHSSSIVDEEDVYADSYATGDSPTPLGEFVRSYLDEDGALYDVHDNFDPECPGGVSEYSNIGIGLLGYLVELIAGAPFDEVCRARIFAPLGMTEASFRLSNLDEARLATPYVRGGSGALAPVPHYDFATFPDGSMRTSAPALARFLLMMAGGGTFGGARILEEATVREMSDRQTPDLDPVQGLVWFYDFDGLLGHDGGDDGASSFMYFDPASGAGALLVANADWEDADDDARALFERLIAEARGT